MTIFFPDNCSDQYMIDWLIARGFIRARIKIDWNYRVVEIYL
jgi:hypothetical protein